MRTAILVPVVAIILHVGSAQRMFGVQCTASVACPDGSKCVDRTCIDCTCDPLSCIRSVEACKNLNCKEDEYCFLNEEADFEQNSVTVTPKCGKRNPCTPDTCKNNETCLPTHCGLQPPATRCHSNTFEDKCHGVTCPDGYTCLLNFAQCYGWPCNSEVVCADMSACKNCGFMHGCDLEPKPDSDTKPRLFVGKCVAFDKQPSTGEFARRHW